VVRHGRTQIIEESGSRRLEAFFAGANGELLQTATAGGCNCSAPQGLRGGFLAGRCPRRAPVKSCRLPCACGQAGIGAFRTCLDSWFQSPFNPAGSRDAREYEPAPINSSATAISNCVSAYSMPPFETSKPCGRWTRKYRAEHDKDQSGCRETNESTRQDSNRGCDLRQPNEITEHNWKMMIDCEMLGTRPTEHARAGPHRFAPTDSRSVQHAQIPRSQL
jgi:hypothetical protein